MTRDPLEIVERGYQIIWREHDPERAFRGLDPDFEWIVPGMPGGEQRSGSEGTIAFFYEWVEPWQDLHVDWELHRAGAERVLAEVTMRGRGRDSGAPVEMHIGQLWTFRGGSAIRMVSYLDVDEARRAAGL